MTTLKNYAQLADRTNKPGDDFEISPEAASALMTAMPAMIAASFQADRLKAGIIYGQKIREPKLIDCKGSGSSAEQKEILHAALGIFSEGGEILEILNDSYRHSIPLDHVHLAEELGDVLWFVQLMAKNLNFTIEQLMAMNISKLASRYSDKYTDLQAINRASEDEIDAIKKHI